MNTTQISLRHPPDIPQTTPWHLQWTQYANRRQQTPTDANRHQQTPQDSDRCCLSMSGRVPWYLLSPVGMSCSLKMSGDVWGVFGGYLSSVHGNLSRSDVIGGYRDSQSLQYGAKALLRHSPERHNFCHLTLLRHWNIKMVAYKLSKNGWVMLFFVIFRLAREKLLVTVALDHPVSHPRALRACLLIALKIKYKLI